VSLDELIHGAELQVVLAAFKVLFKGESKVFALSFIELSVFESLVDHVGNYLKSGFINISLLLRELAQILPEDLTERLDVVDD
jgi:hypothetical protein